MEVFDAIAIFWVSVIFRAKFMSRNKWFTSISFSGEFFNEALKNCVSLHGR